MKNVEILFPMQYLLNQSMILVKHAQKHCLEKLKNLLDFGDLGIIFKVNATYKLENSFSLKSSHNVGVS